MGRATRHGEVEGGRLAGNLHRDFQRGVVADDRVFVAGRVEQLVIHLIHVLDVDGRSRGGAQLARPAHRVALLQRQQPFAERGEGLLQRGHHALLRARRRVVVDVRRRVGVRLALAIPYLDRLVVARLEVLGEAADVLRELPVALRRAREELAERVVVERADFEPRLRRFSRAGELREPTLDCRACVVERLEPHLGPLGDCLQHERWAHLHQCGEDAQRCVDGLDAAATVFLHVVFDQLPAHRYSLAPAVLGEASLAPCPLAGDC